MSQSQPERRIALIFDDGPHEELTPRFLLFLKQEKVQVSFAYIGKNVTRYPHLAKAAQEAGHEIINHTYTHPHLPELTQTGIRREILDTQRAIKSATEFTPSWLWPPYGHWSDAAETVANDLAVPRFPKKTVYINSEDWNPNRSGNFIRYRATSVIEDLTIINFHEWRNETLEELPKIISELGGKNCVFVTLSELADETKTSEVPAHDT